MSAPESFSRSKLHDFRRSTLGDRDGRPCGIYYACIEAWSVTSRFGASSDPETNIIAGLLSAEERLYPILEAMPFPRRPGVAYERRGGSSLAVTLPRFSAGWNETVNSGGTALRPVLSNQWTDSSFANLYIGNLNFTNKPVLTGQSVMTQTYGDLFLAKVLHVFRTTNPPLSDSIGHSRPRPTSGRCCVFDQTAVLEDAGGGYANYYFRECAVIGVQALGVSLGRVTVGHKLSMMPPRLERRVSPNPHSALADIWPGALGYFTLESGRQFPYRRDRYFHAANLPQTVVPPCCNIA